MSNELKTNYRLRAILEEKIMIRNSNDIENNLLTSANEGNAICPFEYNPDWLRVYAPIALGCLIVGGSIALIVTGVDQGWFDQVE